MRVSARCSAGELACRETWIVYLLLLAAIFSHTEGVNDEPLVEKNFSVPGKVLSKKSRISGALGRDKNSPEPVKTSVSALEITG